MPKRDKRSALKSQPETLKGWQQIASFLGEPVSVVQRWASEGMPVHREGRFVSTSTEELNAWLGKESGKPVHVATEDTDLASELKRGLSFIRGKNQPSGEKSQPRSAEKKKL
jgi:hypothetical protein